MDNYPNFINYDNNQDAFASKIDINLDEPDLYQIPERNLGEDPFSQSLHPSRLLNYGADPLSSLFEQEPTANANKLDYQQSSTSNVFELGNDLLHPLTFLSSNRSWWFGSDMQQRTALLFEH